MPSWAIDPAAVSELNLKLGNKDGVSILQSLPALQGTLEGVGRTPFSPWVPMKPIFAEFGVPADEAWLDPPAGPGLYFWDLHPIFALMAPELSEAVLLELAGLGTGMEFTPETLEQVINDLG